MKAEGNHTFWSWTPDAGARGSPRCPAASEKTERVDDSSLWMPPTSKGELRAKAQQVWTTMPACRRVKQGNHFTSEVNMQWEFLNSLARNSLSEGYSKSGVQWNRAQHPVGAGSLLVSRMNPKLCFYKCEGQKGMKTGHSSWGWSK